MISSKFPKSYFGEGNHLTKDQIKQYFVKKERNSSLTKHLINTEKLRRPQTGNPVSKIKNQHVGSVYHQEFFEQRPDTSQSTHKFLNKQKKSQPNLEFARMVSINTKVRQNMQKSIDRKFLALAQSTDITNRN